MSNKARRPPASRAQQRRAHEREAAARRRKLGIAALVGALVVAAAIVAVVLAGGGSDDEVDDVEIALNGVDLPAFGGGSDPAVGLKAPIFVTENLEGERIVTGGGGGPNDTAKVIVFVAHWCPTCQREVPRVAEWLRSNDLPAGVEVVTVSTFPNAARDNYPPAAWFESVAWPGQVLTDSTEGEIAQAYGMGGVPSWVVIDNTNFVLARQSGAISDADLAALVNLAATGV